MASDGKRPAWQSHHSRKILDDFIILRKTASFEEYVCHHIASSDSFFPLHCVSQRYETEFQAEKVAAAQYGVAIASSLNN